MIRSRRGVAALLTAGLVLSACSGDGGAQGGGAAADASAPDGDVPVDQTIEVGMVDLAYEPPAITVKAGTTVRFVFRNEGALPHQAFFGDEPTQQEYAKAKAKPVGVEVRPGQTRTFVQAFPQPGRLLIGCHIPGHYAAGMKARLIVE